MAIPELTRRTAEKRLARFCLEQATRATDPALALTYRFDTDGITLCTVATDGDPQELARLRFTAELGQWSLHRPDPRGWVLDRSIPPTLDLARLLNYLAQDPFKQYWK